MSVVRRDKRTVRRVGPRRVGTGMVALLALGTGAGCGQSLLRPNTGAGIAAESLGQADMATPTRHLAWVGTDGRRDLPLTAALPPREPDRLNVGLEPTLVASATTWNGWKIPAPKNHTSEPSAPPAGLPLMEVSGPAAGASPTSAIPMPSTRLAGNDAEVETLLAASRDTKIAPPLKHRPSKPEMPVAQAPAPPPIMVVDVLSAPAAEPSTPQVEMEKRSAESAAVVALVNSTTDATAVKSSTSSELASTTSATAPLVETSPLPAPTAPAHLPVEEPRIVTVTQAEPPVADRDADKPVAMAPLDPMPKPDGSARVSDPVASVATAPLDPMPKPEVVALAPVEESTSGLPLVEPLVASPIPPPSEIDALTLASESTGIPLPKRPGDDEVSQVSAPEPTAAANVEERVADVAQSTEMPMPIPVNPVIPAPWVPEIMNIPMPEPRVLVTSEDPVGVASRTTKIPMPIPPVQARATANLTVDYGTTNIPMPVPPTIVPSEDPLAEASRTTNIPLPVPISTPVEDPVSEASRTTNIPMPIPVANPAAVLDPLIEASRSTQIPLPIPPSNPK